MNERSIEIYAYMHAMMGALAAMSDEERAELEAWEQANLDGHSVGTSDWPGWEKYIGSRPRFDDRCKDRSGYVYLIRSGDSDRYKIGISKNPPSRLDALQTGNPEKLSVVCAFWYSDAGEVERELHCLFSSKRIAGQWFNLGEQDVSYIAGKANEGADDI